MLTEDSKHGLERVFVIINGLIALQFNRAHDPCEPRVCAFAPEVEGHIYTINGVPIKGSYTLTNVVAPMKACLADYDLVGGKVLSIDSQQFPRDPAVSPHADISLPYPERMVPHRLFNIAFSDRSNAAQILFGMPGAFVLEYHYRRNRAPVIEILNGNQDPIGATRFHGLPYGFYVCVQPNPHISDGGLQHSKHAWRQFAGHCKNLTTEVFHVQPCDCDRKVVDRFKISDEIIEDAAAYVEVWRESLAKGDDKKPVDLLARAANCKVAAPIMS